MMRCCQWYLILGLGLGIVATGAIFYLNWRNIFNFLSTKEKSLMPGSAAYKEWRRPSVRPIWQVYMYNWTNAASYLEHPGVTSASFRELGPFTYDEYTEVVDAKYHAGNGTLTYRKRTYFCRNPMELLVPGAWQHVNITTVNFGALLISWLSEDMDYALQRELSYLLHAVHQGVTDTRTVGQLLFSGYRSPMWDQARAIVCPRHYTGVLCNDERMAYFRTYNVSRKASEPYSMNMGLSDPTLYGLVQSGRRRPTRNGSRTACDQFEGYTGELFPSRIDSTKQFSVILPELCLKLSLEYEREQTVSDIVGQRYVGKAVGALHGDQNCWSGQKTAKRPGYSMVVSSDCYKAPLYRSMQSSELGRDEIYFVLEPNTGTVLESYVSMRYHTLLQAHPHIALFQEVPELEVPLFRFVRYYRLSDFNARSLTKRLHMLDVCHQMALAGCALGVAIVLIAILYGCWDGRKSPNKADQSRKLIAEYHIVGARFRNGGTVD